MSEAEFLSALRTLPLHPGARGLTDDCAVIEFGSETLIINHDLMAEGTHFRPEADLADVAWKLLAINLSDLASKGAEPIGVLLGHSLGGNDRRFLEGLRAGLAAFDVPILGGDTVAVTGASTFSMTAIGRATHKPVPWRKGAAIGDGLFVTGTLGRAMLGFEGEVDHEDAFNRPAPRLTEGRALAPHVTAMMDVSDGLLLDAFRIAEASQVTIGIESSEVPVADNARCADCMRWGDDYELLFTAPADAKLPVPATRIGTVAPRGFAPLVLDGDPLLNAQGLGYQHG
ncbi:thiamine-monophosphate kinase [Erythrobacter sp. NAP1]|uniref:thiamine-phosphate kinase n=1 Tax=Erythrobacter sp. NAP1 TaxID=237727 RepID=UPI0000686D94|nr:thiamine-phosphate kinase [Erythrobacter sp. NAP1]EAQ29480.1 thiamine-monophosphate kinase [Erythrobacter sp. NAP1]